MPTRAATTPHEEGPAYRAPLRWAALRREDFDGLLLPGGHRARGMREYLESETCKCSSPNFSPWVAGGGDLSWRVARGAQPCADGRSVLFGRRTTAFTWALERAAGGSAGLSASGILIIIALTKTARAGRKAICRSQQEVTRALARPQDFIDVPADAPDYRRKTSGMVRDTFDDERPAFVVQRRQLHFRALARRCPYLRPTVCGHVAEAFLNSRTSAVGRLKRKYGHAGADRLCAETGACGDVLASRQRDAASAPVRRRLRPP